MQSSLSSSPPRTDTLVSIVGGALILLGLFLPMFTGSNSQVAGSAHPIYGWQIVLFPGLMISPFTLLDIFPALPILGMLIILITSMAALFHVPLPRLARLRRAAATGGLTIQIFLEIFILVISSIGYGRTEVAPGFIVIPFGFLITMIGIFIVEAVPDEGQVSLRKHALASLLGTVLIPLDIFAFAFLQLFPAWYGHKEFGPPRIELSWGIAALLLGFFVIAIGSFVIEPSSNADTLRKSAVVNLVGVALTLLGCFLPMFILNHVPVYEWQTNQTSGDATNVSLMIVFGILAALPLLGMLIVLATSIATLFHTPFPQPTWLKRAVAAWGLAAQLLFNFFVLLLVGDSFFEPMFLLLLILCLCVAVCIVIATSRNQVQVALT